MQRLAINRIAFTLPHRRTVSNESQPRQIFEQRGLVLGAAALPIVILDPQQHLAVARFRGIPDVDGVDDVAEVKESGRRRSKTG